MIHILTFVVCLRLGAIIVFNLARLGWPR